MFDSLLGGDTWECFPTRRETFSVLNMCLIGVTGHHPDFPRYICLHFLHLPSPSIGSDVQPATVVCEEVLQE